MKRIVTFVVPLAESEPPDDAGMSGRHNSAGESTDEGGFDPGAMSPGAMKVEVIVSDDQANRIIAAVLEHGSGAEIATAKISSEGVSGDSLEVLVQKELQVSDPADHDLLERIVKRVERQLISQVYSDCDYVKSRAAARLGINRNTLLKKLREFGEIADEAE